MLISKLESGLAPNSVRIIHATIRVICQAAVEDGLLSANPAEKLGRQLHLVGSKQARQEQIKAMTADQRVTFLMTAARLNPAITRCFLPWRGRGCGSGRPLRCNGRTLTLWPVPFG
ncbi:MAG: hypothetical protein KC643_20465, partial [Nitrospira sp.]|nr:hypothetical protein [Nitrospira sp.]